MSIKGWEDTLKRHYRLLQTIKLCPDLDKSKVAEKINVSVPTLYKSLEELKIKGMLNVDSSINPYFGTFVGLSIGTSVCKLVFLHFDFTQFSVDEFNSYKDEIVSLFKKIGLDICSNSNVCNYLHFKTPESFGKLKDYIDCIIQVIESNVNKGELNVLSIGISSTGIIDDKLQTILQSHNLTYLSGRNIKDFYYSDKKDFFNEHYISLYLVQNCNAAMIAEKYYLYEINSEFKNNLNIAAVYLEYGLGAGLVVNGMSYFGTNGFVGEIGHVEVPHSILNVLSGMPGESGESNLKECTCGSNDCVDYIIHSKVFPEPRYRLEDLSSKEINRILIEDTNKAKILGMVLGYISNLFASVLNVDLIIFTGKLSKCIPTVLKYIEQKRDENKLIYNRRDSKLYTSELGTLSPAIGAAIYSSFKKCDVDIDWRV